MIKSYRTIRNLSMILGIMVVVWSVGLQAERCRIRIHPQSEVRPGPVNLGQIAHVVTDDPKQKINLEQLVVGHVQARTISFQIRYADIVQALMQANIHPASLDIFGASVCQLKPSEPLKNVAELMHTKANQATITIPTAKTETARLKPSVAPTPRMVTIKDVLLQHIAKARTEDINRLKVTWGLSHQKLLDQPYAENRYVIEPYGYLNLDTVRFKITERTENKTTKFVLKRPLPKIVMGEVRYLVERVVPRRELQPGDIITADDVKLDIVGVFRRNREGCTDLDSVIGHEVTRVIPMHRVITTNMIKKLIVIKRRDPVDIVMRSGLLYIKSQGFALEAGGMRETIPVRHANNSANIVRGRIVGPGQVEVMAQPIRTPKSEMMMAGESTARLSSRDYTSMGRTYK